MTSLDLAFLPRLFLRLTAPSDLAPSWPRSTDQEGNFCLGAELRLTSAVSMPPNRLTFCPLEAREPKLGWYRIAQQTPLIVECAVGDNAARAVDTAIRLCMLLWVWAHGGLVVHATGLAREGMVAIGLAPSGGGKSTLTDLASGFESLSDETVALLPSFSNGGDDRGFEVWGTPFRSRALQSPSAEAVPLSAILLLEKSVHPRSLPAPGPAVVRALIEQAYTAPPWACAPGDLLRRSVRISSSVPGFYFQFPKTTEAVSLLEEIFAAVGKPHQTMR